MAARSMWNGTLAIGKLTIDVKLYAAIEDTAVHFHLLHDRDEERLEQHMVNPSTGEVREKAEIHKGFELKPGPPRRAERSSCAIEFFNLVLETRLSAPEKADLLAFLQTL